MSSKNKNLSVEKITKADLSPASVSDNETASPASVKLTSGAFDMLGGETFAGLNILKLSEGEAAGPFEYLRSVQQEIPAKGKRKASIVTVHVAAHLSFPGREVRMPIAAAFLGKAADANLAAGDVFAVRRSGDYIDKNYGQKCQGFELKVLARSGQPDNVAKLRIAYPVAN
jgi:hypothetical protein